MDMMRDLRASNGEILLFKKPKRGASSLISDGKAEWGIVKVEARPTDIASSCVSLHHDDSAESVFVLCAY